MSGRGLTPVLLRTAGALALSASCVLAAVPAPLDAQAAAGLVPVTAPTHRLATGGVHSSIPVHDVFTVTVPLEDGGSATYEGVVHAAYAVPEGTVLYWSLREASGTGAGLQAALAADASGLPRLVGGVLADPGSERVLRALGRDGSCLCTQAGDLREVEDGTVWHTMYTTFPPVPARVIDVDVDGAGTVVVGVPVLDRTPEPLRQSPVVPLGSGWPTYPDEQTLRLAAEDAQAAAVQDRVARTESASGTVRVDRSRDGRLVSLETDVLFAFDRADVSPEARQALVDAAADIAELDVERLVVTGHTDTQGSVERNDELSLERAEAVRDVLAAALPGARITVEGRGQWEPVASNAEPEGQARNRRATIAYAAEGAP